MQAEPRRQRRRAVGRRGAGNLQLEGIGDRDGREGEGHRRREERSSTRFPIIFLLRDDVCRWTA